MIYYVNGKKINLTDNDFVFKGGEASIYEKGHIAYKIYTDINDVIPEAKIKELQTLNHPSIISPKDVIFDKKNRIVGFTMVGLRDDNIVLCKLFTNEFREINNIENDQTIKLVENIKNGIIHIHDKKCLQVDGNEFNYMVAKDFVTPYFIDINSYQTQSFPATAIMSSIRDWRSKEFSILTDWFSFAIVSFQLFIGIHPFRGRHKDYKKSDLEKRVIDCVSVFNPKVSCPPPTRDFNLIPGAYKDWYYNLFEKGNRTEPPLLPGEAGIVQVEIILIKSTDNFQIEKINKLDSNILFYNVIHGTEVVKTQEKIYINGKEYKVSPDAEFLNVLPNLEPILVKIDNKMVKFHSLNGRNIRDIQIECTDKMIVDNTLYLKNDGKLIEINLTSSTRTDGVYINPAIRTVWTIERKSSQLFSGIIYQNVLGKPYFGIPIPKEKAFIVVNIPELESYQIVDAKHKNKVCVITAVQNGIYDRFIIVFSDDYQKYKIRAIDDIDYSPINFVVLDNGVCIMMNHDDTIEIFLNRIDKDSVKRIKDPEVNSAMRLYNDGVRVLFSRGKELFSIKMK